MNTKEPSNWFLWVNARWGGRDVGRWSGWRSVVRMSTCRFSYYLALWCRKQVIDWIYLFNVQADGNHQLFRENILSVFNAHSNSMNANAKPWQCAFRFFFFFIPLFVDGERIDCEACLWLECSQIVFFFRYNHPVIACLANISGPLIPIFPSKCPSLSSSLLRLINTQRNGPFSLCLTGTLTSI